MGVGLFREGDYDHYFFRTGRLFSLCNRYNIFEVRHLAQIYFAGSNSKR